MNRLEQLLQNIDVFLKKFSSSNKVMSSLKLVAKDKQLSVCSGSSSERGGGGRPC